MYGIELRENVSLKNPKYIIHLSVLSFTGKTVPFYYVNLLRNHATMD